MPGFKYAYACNLFMLWNAQDSSSGCAQIYDSCNIWVHYIVSSVLQLILHQFLTHCLTGLDPWASSLRVTIFRLQLPNAVTNELNESGKLASRYTTLSSSVIASPTIDRSLNISSMFLIWSCTDSLSFSFNEKICLKLNRLTQDFWFSFSHTATGSSSITTIDPLIER